MQSLFAAGLTSDNPFVVYESAKAAAEAGLLLATVGTGQAFNQSQFTLEKTYLEQKLALAKELEFAQVESETEFIAMQHTVATNRYPTASSSSPQTNDPVRPTADLEILLPSSSARAVLRADNDQWAVTTPNPASSKRKDMQKTAEAVASLHQGIQMSEDAMSALAVSRNLQERIVFSEETLPMNSPWLITSIQRMLANSDRNFNARVMEGVEQALQMHAAFSPSS